MTHLAPDATPADRGYRPINNAPTAEIGAGKELLAANMVGVDSGAGPGQRWLTLMRPVACSSHGAKVFTVSLGVQEVWDDIDEGAARYGGVLFLLKWGVGGAQFEAIVDGRLGQLVTLLGSSLEVSAGFSVIDVPSTPSRAHVVAGLSHGTRVCCNATRTYPEIDADENEPAATRTVAVPPFAYAVQIYADDGDYAMGAFGATMRGGQAGIASQIFDSVDAPALLAAHGSAGYRFNNQTRYIEVSSAGGQNLTLSFALGF